MRYSPDPKLRNLLRAANMRLNALLALTLLVAVCGVAPGEMPEIIHLCDPGNWLIARHGEESLKDAVGAGAESFLVVTGGALSSSASPANEESAFTVRLLDAAGVDVVNLAHRDFVGELADFDIAVTESRARFISASFQTEGQTWRPFTLERMGDKTVAFIGVAARSPSMELPDSGLIPGMDYIQPPQAVRDSLARIRDADSIIVLADMPLADAIALRREFPRVNAVICSGRGGVQLDEAQFGGVHISPPDGSRAAVFGGEEPGNRIAVIRQPREDSAGYTEARAMFDFAFEPIDEIPTFALEPPKPMPGLTPDETSVLNLTMENRAARWTIHSVSWLDSFGPARAAEGRRWLVIDIEWENLLAPQLVRDEELPVEYRIPALGNHLYLVMDGRRVAPMQTIDGIPNLLHAESGIILPRHGSTGRGNLIYDLPADIEPESKELRFYDFAHGHMFATALDARAPDAEPTPDEPIQPLAVNEIVELGVYDMAIADEIDGRRAPAGMTFVSIDLRARSMFTFQADAAAFIPGAERGEKIEIGTVCDWLEALKYSHLVVDGEYGYAPDAELTYLAADPRFLPDLMTGDRMVFLAPDTFESLAFRGDFPNARMPDGRVIRPQPIRIALRGEPLDPPERDALWRVKDDTLDVAITGVGAVDRFAGVAADDNSHFIILDVTVSNSGDKPEFFQTARQLRYVDQRGRQSDPHRATFEGLYRPTENVWVPNEEQRTFQVAYLTGRDELKPRVSYRGFTLAEIVELPELRETVQVAELPAVEEEPDDQPPDLDEDLVAVDDDPIDDVAVADEPDEPFDVDAAVVEEPEEVEPAAEGIIGFTDTWTLPKDEIEEWIRQRNRTDVNLALGAYGGLVSTENRERVIPLINNGRIDGYRSMSLGISHIDLAGAKPASINQIAVVFHIWPENMRLIFEAADGEGGYKLIGSMQDAEKPELHLRAFEFEPIVTDEIRMTIDSTDGRRLRLTWLYEVMAFEGPLADKSKSVLSSGGLNISRHERGGSIFHTSDVISNLGGLLTAPDDRRHYAKSWRRDDAPWTEPIKMAFQANRIALIDAIELWPSDTEAHKALLPARIRLSASVDQPFEGHTAIGEFEVTTDGEPWRLEFDQPVRARFLQFQFLPREVEGLRYGQVVLGELVVYEGTEPDYVSVMIRGDGAVWRHREQLTLDELMGEEAANVRSFTDDFLAENVVDFGIGEWVGSTISRPEQTHRFRVNLEYDSAAEIPELHLRMAPFIRGKVRILDAEGNEVAAPSPARQSGTAIQFPLALDPGEYIVEVSSSPIYLFLGFDTSGSMTVALPITRDNLPDLTDNLPEGVYVALGTSLSVRGISHGSFTLYSDYTNDPDALRHAITEHKIEFANQEVEMFKATGRSGSDWYNFLKDMMEWADENAPPEAVTALVLVGDGVGRGDYIAMWERLRVSRQRLYTVGWGSQTLRLDHMDWSTGWSAARGLFNAAWYRDGRYFEPQADHEIVETYREILKDVQSPADYAMRIYLRPREIGSLITAAPPAREGRPILFVLDASGSMMIELEGRTRLAVAFDVMERIVNGLPDDAQVGLRVYGHRFRDFGDEAARAAVDSELLIPISKLDKASFMRTVRAIRARGATPLAHTIEQIPGDLRGIRNPLVIVLTDGVESFRRDPVAKCRTLRQRHPDMEFVVVGFMIDRMVDRDNLRGMAEAGEGVYYNAMDSKSLVVSMEEAVNPAIRFAVHDADGKQVAEGLFGDRHELPEGRYILYAFRPGERATTPITIQMGRALSLSEGDLPAFEPFEDGPEVVAPAEDDAPAPAEAPRFCTQCGQRLGEGDRFCTGCGARVQ